MRKLWHYYGKIVESMHTWNPRICAREKIWIGNHFRIIFYVYRNRIVAKRYIRNKAQWKKEIWYQHVTQRYDARRPHVMTKGKKRNTFNEKITSYQEILLIWGLLSSCCRDYTCLDDTSNCQSREVSLVINSELYHPSATLHKYFINLVQCT